MLGSLCVYMQELTAWNWYLRVVNNWAGAPHYYKKNCFRRHFKKPLEADRKKCSPLLMQGLMEADSFYFRRRLLLSASKNKFSEAEVLQPPLKIIYFRRWTL